MNLVKWSSSFASDWHDSPVKLSVVQRVSTVLPEEMQKQCCIHLLVAVELEEDKQTQFT